MPVPICTRASYVEGWACLQTLNARQRKAFIVYVMSRQLAAIGGTDYTLGPDGTLNDAVACLVDLDKNQVTLANMVVENNNAVAAGADIPSDIQEIAEAIKCLENFEDNVLLRMQLHLRCSLGRAMDYPQ